MKRPEKWTGLPSALQKNLMHHDIELDYDCYDSSRVEAIENLLHNPEMWTTNFNIVQRYYESLSNEQLVEMAKECIANYEWHIRFIDIFLKE